MKNTYWKHILQCNKMYLKSDFIVVLFLNLSSFSQHFTWTEFLDRVHWTLFIVKQKKNSSYFAGLSGYIITLRRKWTLFRQTSYMGKYSMFNIRKLANDEWRSKQLLNGLQRILLPVYCLASNIMRSNFFKYESEKMSFPKIYEGFWELTK